MPELWRVGRHYPIHVYEGDTPVATFFTADDARRAVNAVNERKAAEARICSEHQPIQHRDGKPAWCRACGLTAAFEQPVSSIGSGAVPDKDDGPYGELSPYARQLLADYVVARNAAQDWEDKRRELRDKLIDAMAGLRRGLVNGQHVVTHTVVESERFSQSRFKAAMPDLYKDFLVPERMDKISLPLEKRAGAR